MEIQQASSSSNVLYRISAQSKITNVERTTMKNKVHLGQQCAQERVQLPSSTDVSRRLKRSGNPH